MNFSFLIFFVFFEKESANSNAQEEQKSLERRHTENYAAALQTLAALGTAHSQARQLSDDVQHRKTELQEAQQLSKELREAVEMQAQAQDPTAGLTEADVSLIAALPSLTGLDVEVVPQGGIRVKLLGLEQAKQKNGAALSLCCC